MNTGPPPLQGLRVLDFSRLFAGPMATMTLADLGAEVIKIESPDGDEARRFGPPFLGGEGMNFMALNRGKASVAVNLKTADGLALVRRLAEDSDIVVENFRPGVADRLGIGYQELSASNQGLIYCSISGYGPSAAASDRPALDIVLQAVTGVMDRQGRGGRPEMLVVTLADTYAASLAVQSVLAALLHRGRTGAGQHVEVTLYEALIAAQGYRIITPAEQAMLPAVNDVVPYQAFRAGDGLWLVVAVVSDANWQALCAALARPGLAANPGYAGNAQRVQGKSRLIPLLEAAFATCGRAEWLEALREHGVPAAPVLRVEDLLDDPDLESRGAITRVSHPTAGQLRTMGSPLHLSASPVRLGGAAPLLGQHTREVLLASDTTSAELSGLAARGVISGAGLEELASESPQRPR